MTDVANGSLNATYGGLPGGAVVYLALPMIRDATAAGGQLVRAVYGPQPGRHYDQQFGPFFRTDRAPGAFDDLPQRTVVFAAIHAAEFEAWVKTPEALSSVLSNAHPDAPDWWQTLREDDVFVHLSGSAPAWRPPPEELERGRPEVAWRPFEALLDRALEYGLSVLGRD